MVPERVYRAGFIRRYRSGHSGLRLPPQPGKPPVDVMLVIIAVVAAWRPCKLRAVLMSCCKLPRSCAPQPEICLNCRAVCDLYTDHLCGTGHVVYTILPIIYDVAIRTTSVRNVRWRQVLSVHRWDYRQSGVGCGRVSGCNAG